MKNGPKSFWKEDLARYPRRPFLKEQSIWAIAVYRFGRWNDARKRGLTRWLFGRLYWVLFRIVETLTGVSFTKGVEIGPGLRVWHFGGIFIHDKARIGARCTLHQGVTVGNRYPGGPAPVIGDDVEFGAYAQVLGDVRVGNGAKIGAMSVVLQDVPDGATAVGIPARIIMPKGTEKNQMEAERDQDARSGRDASRSGSALLLAMVSLLEMF
jgi:serine O-acetyltransferase